MISLVGLPGCGKSTIGRRLASRLGWTLIDTDLEIETRLACSIAAFFEQRGERSFRDVEQEILDNATRQDGVVIATGGGVVLRKANRLALRERSTVVYLNSPISELAARLARDSRRPLLSGPGELLDKLNVLSDARDALYRETAHVIVSLAGMSTASAAVAVVHALEQASRWPVAKNPAIESRPS